MAKSIKVAQNYALLIVLEYGRPEYKDTTPQQLKGMMKDLIRAWNMAISSNISPENITVITDILPRDPETGAHVNFPWTAINNGNHNPNIINIVYPSINKIIAGIIQFVENTLRGIKAAPLSKGDCDPNAFFYYSGHGASFTSSVTSSVRKLTNAFILLNENGSERRYLSHKEFFEILTGEIKADKDGYMSIPIWKRSLKNRVPSKRDYEQDVVKIQVEPSPSYHDRGLPKDTELLAIMDACHTGNMSHFPYEYTPDEDELFRFIGDKNEERKDFPHCISISVTTDLETSPSLSIGSPFTLTLADVLNKYGGSLTLETFFKYIRENLHESLDGVCTPTLTTTIPDKDLLMPVFKFFSKRQRHKTPIKVSITRP